MEIKINKNLSGRLYCAEPFDNSRGYANIVIVPGGAAINLEGGSVSRLEKLAEGFCSKGYLVFIYDGRGLGESQGVRIKQSDTVEDLSAVLSSLSEEAKVWDSSKPLLLFGFSSGGAAALKIDHQQFGVNGIICYGTLPCYSRAFADKRTLTIVKNFWKKSGTNQRFEDFAIEYCDLDPISFGHKLNVPVLFSGGSNDQTYFKYEEQEELRNCFCELPAEPLLELKGLDHFLNGNDSDFEAAVDAFAGWFDNCRTKNNLCQGELNSKDILDF